MKKNIKTFIKKNKIKIITNNLNKKILLTDRMTEDSIFFNSLSAYICNKYLSLDADLLTDLNENNDFIELFKSFNIKNIFYLSYTKIDFKILILLLNSFFHLLLIVIKILFLGSNWFVKKFKIKNIYFGDIIYDTYVRKEQGFLYKNFINIKFIKILFIGLYRIKFIDQLLIKNKYSLVVCNTDVYTSSAAIALRLSLKRKINVLMIVNNFFRFYTNLNQAFISHITVEKKHLKVKSKNYKNWKKKINFYLNKRFTGEIKDRDAIKAFNKNKASLNDFLSANKINLKKYNRIGFFAPHAFSDANYAAGGSLFLGFFDQFKKTVEMLKEEKKILWFINPHPNSALYNENYIIENYMKAIKSENLITTYKKINTYDLLKISDIILTGKGTVGIEAACLGKKPILSGPAPYSLLGFTHNPKNLNEYKNLILNKNSNYKLSKKQIYTAKKAFYTMAFKNSHVKSKIFPNRQLLDIDLKNKKIVQKFHYSTHASNSILDKINKKDNKDLLNDPVYLSLKDFILQNKKLIK